MLQACSCECGVYLCIIVFMKSLQVPWLCIAHARSYNMLFMKASGNYLFVDLL